MSLYAVLQCVLCYNVCCATMCAVLQCVLHPVPHALALLTLISTHAPTPPTQVMIPTSTKPGRKLAEWILKDGVSGQKGYFRVRFGKGASELVVLGDMLQAKAW